jgi:hypothetical protein
MLALLLLGLLVLREPRFQELEERFLRWALHHSDPQGPEVPLTVVEIGRDPLMSPAAAPEADSSTPPGQQPPVTISPLEFALFVQSVLDFQPSVIAFENVLRWRERDRDQEQVFLDQAMRVPKLLLAAELGPDTDPDAQWGEIRGFPNVSGRRGDLASFSGITRQPSEELRLISTAGYINLPEEIASDLHVPLLFQFRGEVIPSFALQAVMLWLQATAADVKVVLGSHIELPQNRRIPIAADGTMLINPSAAKRARRLSLNELLLAAQQRDTGQAGENPPLNIQNQVVLARTPANPLAPPDVFAATIATIQLGKYVRRVPHYFDYAVLVLIVAFAWKFPRLDRFDLVLYGIAFTAAYGLVALALLSRWSIWIPGVLPLAAIWLAILGALVLREKKKQATVVVPPPVA